EGVLSTPKVGGVALEVLRRPRLLERFLVDVMGFGWHEVHEMTEPLERGITAKLSERMAGLTGHPTRCPHGEPIPSLDGVMPVVIGRPRTEWPVGEPGRGSRGKA